MGGGGGLVLMHETRMHENYDLRWSQTWPLFFYFLQTEAGGKPSSFSSTLFVFFSSPKKKKKRIRNKIGKRKQKKENRKIMPFFYCQQV